MCARATWSEISGIHSSEIWMGRNMRDRGTLGAASLAAASAPRPRRTLPTCSPSAASSTSSSSSKPSTSASAAAPMSPTPSSSPCPQVVREVKQLWERCTAAASAEKLLLAAERLFERLSSSLEQHALVFPADAVQQQQQTSATEAAAEAPADGGCFEQQSDCVSSSSSNSGSSSDADRGGFSWRGTGTARLGEEEKIRVWLQAAAKQFLLLLCELLDAEEEDLQQGGLSFCMRVVAHTHRVQAAAALRRSSSSAAAAGPAATPTSSSSPPRLLFPLSTYQLLLSRVLQARHFSSALATSLVQQFLLPHPDLRFYFLVVARKVLEGQREADLGHSQKQQQQRTAVGQASLEQDDHVLQRPWYRWPAAVGPAAAAERLYAVLGALPLPQKSCEKRRANSGSGSRTHGEGGISSSSDSETDTRSGSSSSGEGGSTTADDDSDEGSSTRDSEESSSSSERDGGGREQRNVNGKKKTKNTALGPGQGERDKATTSYAVKSCYLLKINTRRCCDPSEYRRLFERVWLLFLRCSASVWRAAQLHGKSLLHHLLLSLPRVLLPYMSNPLLLADFFLEAFDTRGDAAVGDGVAGDGPPSSRSSSGDRTSSSTAAACTSQDASSGAESFDALTSASSVSPTSPPSRASSSAYFAGCEGAAPVPPASPLCVAAGRSTAFSEESVLALSGLFYLLTQHRLGDPDALWRSEGVQEQQREGRERRDSGSCSPSDGETGATESNSDSEVDAAESGAPGEKNQKEGGTWRAAADAVATESSATGESAECGGAVAADSAAVAASANARCPPPATAVSCEGRGNSGDSHRQKTRAAVGGVHVHFYGRLYELLTPAAFSTVDARARRRFLRLLSLALRSPLLPTHLVASFLKKCCRVACLVSPGGAVYLAGLVFVLLRKHAAVCSALIDVPLALAQELVVEGGDPFDYNELSLQQDDVRRRLRAGEEEERDAKRPKNTAMGQHRAVAGNAGDVDERTRTEPLLSQEQMKNKEAVSEDASDAESAGQRQNQQRSEPFEAAEAEHGAAERTADDDAMPRADLVGFTGTQPQALYELVLACAPCKSEQLVRQGEGTAGVQQGALLATESVKHQAKTALWELELLRQHYDPAVRQFVSLFDVAFSSSSATGKRARAAAAMAATLDPDDYYWRLDCGALLQHECKAAAKKSSTAVPAVANRANLPPPDVTQLANAAVSW